MNYFILGQNVRLTADHEGQRAGSEFRVCGVSQMNDRTIELVSTDGTGSILVAPVTKLAAVTFPEPGSELDAYVGWNLMRLDEGPFPPFSTDDAEALRMISEVFSGDVVHEVSEIPAMNTWIVWVKVPDKRTRYAEGHNGPRLALMFQAEGRSNRSAAHATCVAALKLLRDHPDLRTD